MKGENQLSFLRPYYISGIITEWLHWSRANLAQRVFVTPVCKWGYRGSDKRSEPLLCLSSNCNHSPEQVWRLPGPPGKPAPLRLSLRHSFTEGQVGNCIPPLRILGKIPEDPNCPPSHPFSTKTLLNLNTLRWEDIWLTDLPKEELVDPKEAPVG